VEEDKVEKFFQEMHDLARAKGWWNHPKDHERAGQPMSLAERLALIPTKLMLAVGELAEGMEEYRKKDFDATAIYYRDTEGVRGEPDRCYSEQVYDNDVPLLKPEGMLVELADTIIRCVDLAGATSNVARLVRALREKHQYNATRSHRHGGKRA